MIRAYDNIEQFKKDIIKLMKQSENLENLFK